MRFEVDFDLEAVVHDCDCSICAKKGFLHIIVPKSAFRLVSGADSISTYTFNTRIAKHTFCSHCGMHPFYTPRSHPDGVDVNARCLDDWDSLKSKLKIEPFHGREWEENIDTIR